MADPAAFFARWSRLKQQARQSPPEGQVGAPKAQEAAPAEAPPSSELPSLESLTADSDFSVFMRPNVPEALRQAALQKLWRSDPLYANLDGLLEYGEDYAAAFSDTTVVGTAYRVLQGMPGGEEPTAASHATEPSAEAQPSGAEIAPPPEASAPPVEEAAGGAGAGAAKPEVDERTSIG